MGAFGGMLAPSPVQQSFAEPAKEDGEFVLGNFALGEIDSAGLDEIGGGAQWPGNTYRLFTNFIEIGHCTCLQKVSRLPAINVKDWLVRMNRPPSEVGHYIINDSSVPHEFRTISWGKLSILY
jgi:hypothetical protein